VLTFRLKVVCSACYMLPSYKERALITRCVACALWLWLWLALQVLEQRFGLLLQLDDGDAGENTPL
jgi:hypothetical protein